MRFTYPWLNSGGSVIAEVLSQKSVTQGNAEQGNHIFLLLRHRETDYAPKAFRVQFKTRKCLLLYVCTCIHIHAVKTAETSEHFLCLPASFSKMLENECHCFCNTDSFEQLLKPKIILHSSSFKKTISRCTLYQ